MARLRIEQRLFTASAALSILNEQLPVPDLPSKPAALMAGCVELGVTADKVVLRVPAP